MSNTTTTTILPASDQLLAMSSDGRYIAYSEMSGTLDTLYVLDLSTLQSALIDGFTPAGDASFTDVSFSANGDYLFYSEGIGGESPESYGDLFIKDLTNVTAPINVTPTLPGPTGPGGIKVVWSSLTALAISNDGNVIVYNEDYNDLSGGNPQFAGLVVDNRTTGIVEELNSPSLDSEYGDVSLSGDGRYLSFEYDVGGAIDEFIQDLQTGSPVEVASAATSGVFIGGGASDGLTLVSADQRYVAYDALTNIGGPTDIDAIFLHDNDAPAGTPDQIITASADGVVANNNSFQFAFSGNGEFDIFESDATNLVPGIPANNTTFYVYIKDIITGGIRLLDDGGDFISYDGSRIVSQSSSGIVVTTITGSTLTIDRINGDDYVNAADGSTITVSGTSGAIGKTVIVSLPGGLLSTASAIVQADGTWSTTISTSKYGDGAINLHAAVTDDFNNTTTVDHPFTIDRTPPQLDVSSVAGDNYINAAELTHAAVVGTVAIGDPVVADSLVGELQIKIDNGPSTEFSTQFSPTNDPQPFSDDVDAAGFADGAHTVTVTAVDEAGNTTVRTIDVIIDTTPPKIAITSISGDDVINPTELKTEQGIQGTSDAIGQTVTVSLNGVEIGQAVVQADGTWIATGDFAAANSGENLVTADVDDEAGNPGEASAGVFVDRGFSAQQLSDGPGGQQGGGSGVMFPELDGAGDKLVFTGLNFNLMSTATGSSGAQVYIKDLTTGAITFATPDPSQNAEFGAISPDGRYIEFVTDANLDPTNPSYAPGLYFTYTTDLTTGTTYFHNLTDDAYDGTDPDTLDPGITPSYYDLGNYPDKTPIQPLPVFPLATADGGNSLELIDDLEPDQVVQPLVMTTQIRLDVNSLDTDGTPFFYSGGYAEPDAIPPADNDFGRFVLQEFAPQISADGSVMAFEARFFGEQWDTSGYPPAVTIEPPTLPEIYAGPTPPEDDGGGGAASELASSYADGTPMPFGAIDPALSADGQFVAFWSWDNDDKPEVYVKNLATGELKVASSDALGNPGVDNASGTFNAGFNTIAISADGRYVAFTSDAVLTSDDSGTTADLFVKDMQTGAITRVNLPAGTFANDLSTQLTMTADGGYVAFVTSKGLSPLDNNTVPDIYGVSIASLGTPPQIAINPVTGDDKINAAEDSSHVTVSGTSDAIGQTVTLYVDGGFLPGVVVAADGTWSTSIDATGLIDGVHQLRATVAAADGATNTDGDLITIDTVAPTVVLSSDKTHLTAGQTATITATFSEGIGGVGADFLTASGGTLSQQTFVNDHTLTEIFTPDTGVDSFTIRATPDSAFDFSGNPNVGTNVTIGLAFDGDFSGSFVFADANDNGVYDVGEVSTTTDAAGNFALSGGSGPLIMTGGTDISTGLPFTGKLEAPEGSAVVSPLTTLVEKLVETSGDTAAQADDAVVWALGLPAGTDLTTLDAVAGAQSGDPASTAAFKAGSELLDAITLIQAAGGSPDAAYAAFVTDITAASAAGTTVDPADAATIDAIAQLAGLDATAAQAVASIASETSAALEQQLLNATSPLEIFTDITGSSIAEQGDAASVLSKASGDAAYQQVADSYFQDLGATLTQDDLIAADQVACYCRGTLIQTPKRKVPVEALKIGDPVTVMSGTARPIKWIGRRSYNGRFLLGRKDMLPICIRAGALADNVPCRDLWISPHHAMYFAEPTGDGMLIEVKDLTNGVSIVQAERIGKVEYFHIELETHDVILAEGTPSETFIDDDSRGIFHNAHEYRRLYSEEHVAPAHYFAPRVDEGYELETIRQRIARRAGLSAGNEATPGALRGFVDRVTPHLVEGWAQNADLPEVPVCLDILAGGTLVGQALANRYREDLKHAGLGSGCHSFAFRLPSGLSPARNVIEVRRSLDRAVLPLSTQVIRFGEPDAA